MAYSALQVMDLKRALPAVIMHLLVLASSAGMQHT